jgi:hypothetical protein
MKPEQDGQHRQSRDWPPEQPLEKLPPPEIVGQVDTAVLETTRRIWWRAFDRVCSCFVVIPLLILDRILGAEPPTPADLKREADHERLMRAFPSAHDTMRRKTQTNRL